MQIIKSFALIVLLVACATCLPVPGNKPSKSLGGIRSGQGNRPIIASNEEAPIPTAKSAKDTIMPTGEVVANTKKDTTKMPFREREPVDEFCSQIRETKEWRVAAQDERKLARNHALDGSAKTPHVRYKQAAHYDERAAEAFAPILQAHKDSGCIFANPENQNDGHALSDHGAPYTNVDSLNISPHVQEIESLVGLDTSQILELYSSKPHHAMKANEWESCIQACEDYERIVPDHDEAVHEIMKLRIKATYLWAEELRKKAAANRDKAETLMTKKVADDYDWHRNKVAAMNAHGDAIDKEFAAAEAMARLLIAHKHTDCVYAKIDLSLGEVSLPPVSER